MTQDAPYLFHVGTQPPHTFPSRGSGTYQWLALPISHFVSWHKANFSLLPPLLPYTESIWLFPWYLCELISIHAHYQGIETWVMVVRILRDSGLGLLWWVNRLFSHSLAYILHIKLSNFLTFEPCEMRVSDTLKMSMLRLFNTSAMSSCLSSQDSYKPITVPGNTASSLINPLQFQVTQLHLL